MEKQTEEGFFREKEKVKLESVNTDENVESFELSDQLPLCFTMHIVDGESNNEMPMFEMESMGQIKSVIAARDALIPPKIIRKGKKRVKRSCPVCGKVFGMEVVFRRHLNGHSNEDFYFIKCDVCSSFCCSEQDLDDHKVARHGLCPFPCDKCARSFPNPDYLAKHVAIVHECQKTISCRLCEKRFDSRYSLKVHINTHLEILLYVCEYCGRRFAHSSNLKRHIQIHLGHKSYVCYDCGVRFRQLNLLQQHRIQSHSTSTGTCPECPAQFSTPRDMTRHAKKQHGLALTHRILHSIFNKKSNRKFHCNVCGLMFELKKALLEHIRQVHVANCFQCGFCKLNLTSQDCILSHNCEGNFMGELKENWKMIEQTQDDQSSIHVYCLHGDEECVIELSVGDLESRSAFSVMESESGLHELEKESENSYELEDSFYSADFLDNFCEETTVSHNLNRRKVKSNFSLSNSQSKLKQEDHLIGPPFNCGDCGKQFSRKWNFYQHIAIHNSNLRRYGCDICHLTFAYRSSFNLHKQRVHASSGEPTFPCDVCSKVYKTCSALGQHHKKTHLNIRRFSCEQCDRSFYQKSDFEYHMRHHTDEQPYMCQTCGRTFKHSSHLIRHERLHNGDRPFQCTNCERSFIQRASLKNHMAKQHSRYNNGKELQPIESPHSNPELSSQLTLTEPQSELLDISQDLIGSQIDLWID